MAIALGYIAVTVGSALGKELLKQHVGNKMAESGAESVVDLIKDPSKLFRKRGDAELFSDAVKKIIRDLGPSIDAARGRLDNDTLKRILYAVDRIIVTEDLSATAMIGGNLSADVIKKAFISAAEQDQKSEQFGDVAWNLECEILDRLADDVVDISNLLSGWEIAYPRAVLERLAESTEAVQLLRADLAADRANRIRDFEREYRDAIVKEFDRLDLIGLPILQDPLRSQRLSVAYISLASDSYRSPKGKNEEPEDAGRAYEEDARSIGINVSGAVEDVLSRARRIVVRGEAGAGKTTLLRWAAIQSASTDLPDRPAGWNEAIPFYLPLRRLKDGQFPTVGKFIELSVSTIDTQPDENWTLRQLRSGNAVMLIDGLDELRAENRDGILDGLSRLMERFPCCRYILSSRPTALNELSWPRWNVWADEEGFVQVTLRQMNADQISRFVDHWHDSARQCFPDPDTQTEWATLPYRLMTLLRRKDLSIGKLAATPILCAMICLLHVSLKERTPSERKDLYDACLDMLLQDRDDRRQIPASLDYPMIGKSDRRMLAQELAFRMLGKTDLDIDVVEVDKFFDGKYRSTPGVGIRRLFEERCNLLHAPVEGKLNFRHKTFQEFLAAEYSTRYLTISKISAKATDDNWRETIVMAASMMRRDDADNLVSKLVLNRRRNNPLPFTTALACLANDNVSPEIRQTVVEACQWLLPPTSDEHANAIAKAGDAVVPYLGPQDQINTALQVYCVRALIAIGSASSVECIRQHVSYFDLGADAPWFDSNFSETILQGIGQLEDLDYTRLVLPELKHIVLTTNPTFAVPWHFLPKLETLRLASSINDDWLTEIGCCLALDKINTGGAGVTDGCLRHIFGCERLKSLYLYNSKITNDGARSIVKNLPALTHLHLGETLISDEALDEFYLPDLVLLGIGGNDMTDRTLEQIAKLNGLKHLYVPETLISDDGLRFLADMKDIQTLSIGKNTISDRGLEYVAQLTNLQSLYIGDTDVTDACLASIQALPKLRDLRIENTALTDAVIDTIERLPHVVELAVSGTHLSSGGIERLSQVISHRGGILNRGVGTLSGRRRRSHPNRGPNRLY